MTGIREFDIEVRGMTCDHCERTVAKALAAVPGVVKVEAVSHKHASARISATGDASAARIERAVAKAGYTARVRVEQPAPTGPTVVAGSSDLAGPRVGDAHDYDLLIVGGGSAGFSAAIKGAELGFRVAMAEGGTLGGTCVNVGCVPSKTLIRAAEAQHRRVHHGFDGIAVTDGRPDWPTVRAAKDALVTELRDAKYWGVLRSYEAITLIEQRAEFTGGRAVRLADGTTITARKIVVTTGASAWAPPIPGLAAAGYLDNVTAMALEKLPASMLVIGASAVGLELAQMFCRLGVQITVLEAAPRVVPAEDPDVGDALGDYLRAEGLTVHAGVKIVSVARSDGHYRVSFKDGETVRHGDAEQLLVATGRRANTAGFGLEAAGVKLGRRGEIVVNAFLQTANPDIYAAGDVIGDPMFVYVAAYGGALAAENALIGNARKYDLSVVPKVTFTDPGVASVGFTADQARQAGIEPLVSKLPLEHVPRSLAARDTRGFVQLVADAATRKIIGGHVLAAEAGEMITEVALAIRFGLTIEDLTSMFHPYLTLSEGIKLAAQTFDKDVSKLSCCAT
ncbi:MAG: mercury(II) reductase [Gemmatimonadetes bacterium]|nr:mercury(II) reductase [Gemmatimonadota bacterium]